MSAARGMLAGAVLTGGRSRRMGRDKARLRVGGEPLWQRQMRVLQAAGAEPVLVVRRAGQRSLARDVPHVRDRIVDAGPLAGLEAALSAVTATGSCCWVAVLAVDMPAIEPEWFVKLRRLCRAGVGAVARYADGYEPLAAIYPCEALATVTRRLERGERSLQDLVKALIRARKMRVLRLAEDERWRVANWNTPADLTAPLSS